MVEIAENPDGYKMISHIDILTKTDDEDFQRQLDYAKQYALRQIEEINDKMASNSATPEDKKWKDHFNRILGVTSGEEKNERISLDHLKKYAKIEKARQQQEKMKQAQKGDQHIPEVIKKMKNLQIHEN